MHLIISKSKDKYRLERRSKGGGGGVVRSPGVSYYIHHWEEFHWKNMSHTHLVRILPLFPVVLKAGPIITVLQFVLFDPLTINIPSLRCYTWYSSVIIAQINLQPLIGIWTSYPGSCWTCHSYFSVKSALIRCKLGTPCWWSSYLHVLDRATLHTKSFFTHCRQKQIQLYVWVVCVTLSGHQRVKQMGATDF